MLQFLQEVFLSYKQYYIVLSVLLMTGLFQLLFYPRLYIRYSSNSNESLSFNAISLLFFISFFLSMFGYKTFMTNQYLIVLLAFGYIVTLVVASIIKNGPVRFLKHFYHPSDNGLLYHAIAFVVLIFELGLLFISKPLTLSGRFLLNDLIGHTIHELIFAIVSAPIIASALSAVIILFKLVLIGIQCYVFNGIMRGLYNEIYKLQH